MKTRLVIFRALWFAAGIILSIWFLYWICYDVFVWNKALTQVPLLHHVGLVLSIAFILLGTQIGRIRLAEKPKPLIKQSQQEKRIQQTQQVQQVQQVLEEQRIQPIEQVQQIQPAKEEEKQMPQDSSIPPGCRFYLGYLHERPKSVEIPQECLSCINVVNCLFPQQR